jgi:PAS domain S-box-containing protein
MERGSDESAASEPPLSGTTAAGGLTLSRTVLEQLLGQTGDLLFVVGDDGSIESVSDDSEGFLGYTAAEIVGAQLTDLVALDVDDASRKRLLGAEGADEVAIPFETSDGVVVHTVVTAAVAVDGATVCLVRDVSEHVAREDELDRYVQLVESVGDPMSVLDAQGTIELVNEAMVEYTGYPKADLVGRSLEALVDPDEHDKIRRHASNEQTEATETIETTLVTREGESVPSEATISVLRDGDGSPVGTVGVFRDIRDRNRREQDLELLKQVLTRVFRHNIRNELMVVQGYIDLIETTVDDDIEEYLDEIDGAIDALLEYGDKARKIEDVMESPGHTETTLDRELALALGQTRALYPDARIDVDDLPEVDITAHPKITTAIEELLDNAIRHTPPDRTPHITIWATEQANSVTLFIEDNAGGLEDNEVSVLREGTETDLEHSSGVGLWLVQWIVDYSGATLLVERTEQGTLMGIRFG